MILLPEALSCIAISFQTLEEYEQLFYDWAVGNGIPLLALKKIRRSLGLPMLIPVFSPHSFRGKIKKSDFNPCDVLLYYMKGLFSACHRGYSFLFVGRNEYPLAILIYEDFRF
jgi:hypothetical protein